MDINEFNEVQKRPGTKFIKDCGVSIVQLIQLHHQVYAITLDKRGCPDSIDNVSDIIKPNGGIQ